MPSNALKAFKRSVAKSDRLLSLATDGRLRPISYADAEPALHAALASLVSAWESYVEAIVLEYLDAVGAGAAADALAVQGLLKSEATRAIEKFNTATAENCRDLILRFCGYDCFPVLASTRLALNGHLSRLRLNEILRVRHSFAHGYAIPALAWTIRRGVGSRLTKAGVIDSRALIIEFVRAIDAGLSAHFRIGFQPRVAW